MGKRQTLPDIDILRRVTELCALGSRPPIIESIFPSISRNDIAAMWERVQGRRAPKGPLPTCQPSFFAGPARRLQASYLLAVFEAHRAASAGDVDAAINAYKDYCATFPELDPDARMTFDRGWALMRALNRRSADGISLIRCGDCGSRYIHFASEMVNDRNCPIHKCVANFEDIELGIERGGREALRAHIEQTQLEWVEDVAPQSDMFATPAALTQIDWAEDAR